VIHGFGWDEYKAAANVSKHGVYFQEAATVFGDPLARIFYDEALSTDEVREIIIGHSGQGRLLVVCFTERPTAIRIFSARVASRRERRDYEQNAFH